MISKAYVFIDGLESSPVICGVTQIDDATNIGRFRYGKSYLNRTDAFALDPVNLPLTDQEFTTTFNKGVFGALSDAGADSWGKKVILSLHNTKPKNALEFLLAGSGMGVGCLTFSLSRTSTKFKENKNTLGDLSMLSRAKDAILADENVPNVAKRALEYGSSMGGARPKTVVRDNDISYLAKFNRSDDIINIVKAENASMRMLIELGCNVAKTHTVKAAGGDVLLVERFDLHNHKPKAHFLSANSLFARSKVGNADMKTIYTYGYLAEFIMKQGAQPSDAHDLYYRMIFNVLMGNTDDHARNHAFVYSFEHQRWRLSKAYDVLPINQSKMHDIGIGEMGRHGTITNLLSQSLRFGIKRFKAQKMIDEVCELTQQWPYYFTQFGVGEGDIERLKGIIPASVQ
jgi:serine/threonine-protein kinase HipA